MKKNKLKAFLLAICVALPTMFALTACGHKHSFSDDWTSDATNHWHVCTDEDCDETSDSTEHTFVAKKDGTNHWSECSVCGYKKDEAAHNYATTKYDATKHWKECSCGDKKDEEAHTLTNKDLKTYTHNMGCTGCAYVAGEQNHTYEDDDQTQCDVCHSDTRATATLAFKTGTYTFTYDGNAHAFDKTNLVKVEEADLSEVVVEYSVSGAATPVWTTEAPKNANTYNIRISVPATKDHTSAVATKEFKINQIEIDLTNFSRVYSLDEANRNGWIEKVTSADFSVILSSEEVPLTIGKNTKLTTPVSEGTSYDLKWYEESNAGADGDAFAVRGLGDNSNYKIKTGTKGKIYIANSLTATANEGSYSAQATIPKNGYAYYSLKMNRTSENINFDVTLSDSNVEIVNVYSKVNGLTAKLAADGTLVTNGTTGTQTIFIVVKYNGGEDSITNTLTLTQNTATTTVANDTAWGNVLNLDTPSRLHVTLKKDGTVIEENKTDKDNKKYYKNDNGTEVYYNYVASKNYFYKWSKNDAGKWVKELVFTSASSSTEANTSAYNAAKFNSELLNALRNLSLNDLEFSSGDQMYKLASKEISGTNYTNIALKIKAGKLVYAEYELSDNKYTIEVEYSVSNYDIPAVQMGTSKENAFELEYTTGDSNKFSLEDVTLLNGDNWFVIDITEEIFNANKKVSGTLVIDGSFTSSLAVEGLTIEIKLFDSSNTEQTNDKSTDAGKLKVSGLSTGKYYIKVTVNNECTGSWNIGFDKGTIAM